MPLDLVHDIHPLTDFKRNTAEFAKQLKKTERPVVLTVNGRAEMVVQDAQSYQRLMERLERLETLAAIRQGLQDEDAGRVREAGEALEELRVKRGLPRANHRVGTSRR